MSVFEITIQRKDDDAWPVVVRHQPGAHDLTLWSRGRLDLDLEALAPLIPSRKEYGLLLGKALFQDDIRDAFVRAVAEAKALAGAKVADEPLRVLLNVEAEDLRRLHWEQLHAPLDRGWDFLLLNQGTPFSLYLPSQIQLRFPPIGRRDLRALLLVAGPEELDGDYRLDPFDVRATVGSIQHGLGEIPCDVLAPVDGAIGPPTLNALCEHLTTGHYTLLHVVCHGRVIADSGETVLYFPGDENRRSVSATTLIERLGRLDRLPYFTFLSSCESADPQAEAGLGGLGQRLVRELGMPAVVAMTDRISIETAGALASTFYARLGEHGEVDRALCESLAGPQGRYDVTVPALFSRLGGRALWSDTLHRPLTDAEIRYGLEQLPGLLEERAPILLPKFRDHSARILATLGAEAAALSTETRRERNAALAAVNQLCSEALDLSFNALALEQKPPDYDARCPFPGLSAFGARFLATGEVEQDDRAFFFGREALIEQLKEKLAEHNFLPILGPSGSGKSSLLVAGLIPVLQKDEPDLQMAYLTPGSHPLAQLEASRLEVQGKPAVLVVDQFEELFTLCADEGERHAFLDRLLALADEMRVVITMRADFWGDCAPYPALRAEMEAQQKLIAPMDASELRAAMERQAAEVGLRFEADLSNTILDDVRGEPGAMPLLQHALLELWNRRHGRWLLVEEYRDGIGGVQLAIAHTADALYEALSPDDQVRMRDIFLRLTRLGDETIQDEERRDTRQRVRFVELVPAGGDPAPTRDLVQRLADARLVVTGPWEPPLEGQTLDDSPVKVEVAHEALIRHWPRLRGWLDEDRAELRLLQGLRQAALEWQARLRDEAYLVHRGGRLEDAEALRRQSRFTLNEMEQAYVEACVALRERERREKEEQQRRELEAARKLAEEQEARAKDAAASAAKRGRLALLSTFLAILAAVLAIAAFWAASQARQQSRAVLSTALATQSQALLDEYPERSLLLAVEAFKANPSVVAQNALLKAVEVTFPVPSVLRGHVDGVIAIAFSPDNRWLASSSEDWTTRVWDLGATSPGAALRDPLRGIDGRVETIAFSEDSHWLATGNEFGTVTLWESNAADMATEPYVFRESVFNNWGSIGGIAFTYDSSQLFVAVNKKTILWESMIKPAIILVDLATSNAASTLTSLPNPPRAAASAIAVSPNNKWLVVGCRHNLVRDLYGAGDKFACRSRLWNLDSEGADPVLLGDRGSGMSVVAFSPDNHWLVTTKNKRLYLWDLTAPSPAEDPVVLRDHRRAITEITISPDSRWLVTGTDKNPILPWQRDDAIRVWDLSRLSNAPRSLPGHNRTVETMTISPDSRWLATGGEDSSLLVWDLEDLTSPIATFRDQQGPIRAVAFSPDGQWLAAGSDDSTIWLRRSWQSTATSLVDLACQTAGRNLSRTEWETYLVDSQYRKTCDQWPIEEIHEPAWWQFWHWGVWPTIRAALTYLGLLGLSVLGAWFLRKIWRAILGGLGGDG
jgi:WD40 repeat protein/energy-coupling factor transporter ATP-binding protein EcfA2